MFAAASPDPEPGPSGYGNPVTAVRGDLLTPAIKLAGFLILLAVILAGAHAAGARLGPVTTSHSQVQYGGGSPGMGGMKMGITP
jgi:hypothetical protein